MNQTMKKLRPLLLLVIPCQSILAQEVKHAPTVEQCRADQKLWFSKLLELENSNSATAANVRFSDLSHWQSEMLACTNVDQNFVDRYHATAARALAEMETRLEVFLLRHDLAKKFTAEDVQGCRDVTPCKLPVH
jgi:hypothetical protein